MKSSITKNTIKEGHLLQIRQDPVPPEYVEQGWWFSWCQMAFFGAISKGILALMSVNEILWSNLI